MRRRLWKKCGALTWSSQSRRGVACESTQTPAWPAGRAGLWGEGWGQVDRPRARGGCWLPTRTAEGRRVCRALLMNQRRYLQEKQKVVDWVDDINTVWAPLFSYRTTSLPLSTFFFLKKIFYKALTSLWNTLLFTDTQAKHRYLLHVSSVQLQLTIIYIHHPNYCKMLLTMSVSSTTAAVTTKNITYLF